MANVEKYKFSNSYVRLTYVALPRVHQTSLMIKSTDKVLDYKAQ